MKRSSIPGLVTWAMILFFYVPILVLAVNSFNGSRFGGVWGGFSLKWYARLFTDRAIWRALSNSLVIAVGAAVVSMLLGSFAAFAIHRFRSRLQNVHYTLVYVPLVVPEILMGISLLITFVSLGVPLGMGTVFLAHVTFCVSFVTMVILGRLQGFDFSVVEAARDLGADWWVTVRRVLFPLLAPGILAGGMLAFTLSIDDFVITFFVSGPGSSTLPVHIYSMIKHGSPPVINALSVILLLATGLIVVVSRTLSEEKA